MGHVPVLNEAFKVLWWLVPITVITGFLRSSWFKGMLGEALVKFAAKLRLPTDKYYPFHNVTLPTPDGTTQIDHIFVSRFGVFVVETKNMKGWIFGRENQAQWTQKIFRKSFKFQNPLRQNYKHVKALEFVLGLSPDLIHSVIVFVGDSKFKSVMPVNVTRGGGYITYIKSFRELVLSKADVQNIVAQVESARLAPSRQTHRDHVRQLKSRTDLRRKERRP